MRRPREPRELQRSTRFETFEERLALSAQPVDDFLLEAHSGQRLEHHYGDLAPAESVAPVGDFNLNLGITSPADNASRGVQTHLSEAHNLTGVNDVYNTYGFDGAGQTVAIIDSGIAYDHYALGAGFGTSYRVVGGWDFAENDANPYDDGPAGFHGTHVAGIVGSDNVAHRGVASGADLVALRVFDDNGAGYFSWVEDALRWVHDNRDSFENPITTVNLSLGTNWNADSIPSWAMLEDEFAQLELDGIFTSVSAGNSFVNFNAPGLSYPAASSHVVPVASVDDSGLLSYFSQRNDRVLAAPGRSITSTVPDYIFGADGNPNDFGTASGTSMAAPYTAGASALVRQAMEFVGIQNITQDTIYDHFRATADIFYDAATSASYHRINVRAALDALMPADDYGSTVATAHALGVLDSNVRFSGQIGTLEDVDFFTFVAGATGTASFTLAANDGFLASWEVAGGVGTQDGNTLAMDVIAGQSYTVSLQSSAAIGKYDVELELQTTLIDWGAIDFKQIASLSLTTNETWYQLTANRGGTLTVEAAFDSAGGDVDLFLYNSSNELLASSVSGANRERVDASVDRGQTFSLRLAGTNDDVDIHVANLVSFSGDTATIQGTSGDDVFAVVAGQEHDVIVNGIRYVFNATDVTQVAVIGNGGQDSITVTGDASNNTATLSVGSASLVGGSYRIEVADVRSVHMYGGGGHNTATFHDSSGDDRFYGESHYARMMGTGYDNYASGFDSAFAYATGGHDTATFFDSSGDDRFYGEPHYARMIGWGYDNYASGFENVFAYATQGHDTATFFDSVGDDRFYGEPHYARMVGSGYDNYASGFDSNFAYATQGHDTATFFDSAGDDRFYGEAHYARMNGAGYDNYADGFDSAFSYSTLGLDIATFFDSAGDDHYFGEPHYARMMGAGYDNYAGGFSRAFAYSTQGGQDTATFYDSPGDDVFIGTSQYSQLTGNGYDNYARGFGTVVVNANAGGNDSARLYDSAGSDYLRADLYYDQMFGEDYHIIARRFEEVRAYSTEGGDDRATFLEVSSADRFLGRESYARLTGQQRDTWASGFSDVTAHSVANEIANADMDAVDYVFRQIGDWE